MSNIHQLQLRLGQARTAKSEQRGQNTTDQQHWDNLAARIDEPEVARLVVRFLDHAQREKFKHAGLYLRARMVLSDEYSRGQARAKLSRQAWLKRVNEVSSDAAYFVYRCIRLPYRAMHDLVAYIHRPRARTRPLFHH